MNCQNSVMLRQCGCRTITQNIRARKQKRTPEKCMSFSGDAKNSEGMASKQNVCVCVCVCVLGKRKTREKGGELENNF